MHSEKKNTFFLQNIWQIQKKAVPLHPQMRDNSFAKQTERENSSVGRAQPCQGWGRGFESRFSLTF